MERRKMQKKKKRTFAALLTAILVVALTGCSKLGSIINEIHGSLIGNNYTVYTYDNYGNQTLKTSGKKISITGNKIETVSYDSDGRAVTGYDLSSVITITIDGKEIESCGDTCVFVQNGLEPEVDFSLDEVNSNGGNGITDNAALARVLNRYFHHELAVEQAIRNHHYEAARMVGAKSLETTHTLAVLRAYAMSLEGTMGEHLFEYPQYYGAEGLLFAPHSQETLRLNADSLYAYLGARPHVAEKTVDFLARICRDEIGRHTALNYYMSALLLDKKLDKFVSAVDMYCFEQDTLPRYYREALVLYKRTHPGYGREVKDTLMVRRLDEFLNRQKEFSSPVEEKNHMRREYGDTYWWYYRYQ